MTNSSWQTMIKFALRMLRRDWHAGEIRILALSIIVAVTCFTAVAFFTDRIGQALNSQAGELIGADLRIVSDHPIRESFITEATNLNLTLVHTRHFRSMVVAADVSRLAEIKAVGEGYPLRGNVRLSDKIFAQDYVASETPQAGTVWLETTLLNSLSLRVGDSIRVGAKSFQISHVITYEPDRSGEMFSIAPRLMMNELDLAATQLLQEGSRIRYMLLLAGTAQSIDDYRQSVLKGLQRGEKIEGVKDARQEVRIALDRSQQFLGLAAMVSLILSCVAIAMSARRYAERHLNVCALMRCVGAQQKQITFVYLTQMILLAVVASIVGCVFGFFAQYALVNILAGLFVVSLPESSLFPVLTGLAIGIISLTGFALPSVLRLKKVSPLRVIRKDLGNLPPFAVSSYLLGFAFLAVILFWQAGDTKLGFTMLFGILATILLLLSISYLLVRSLQLLPANKGVAWRFGINNIVRHKRSSIIQIMAFGLGIMVLLLLTLVRSDLLSIWKNSIPEDASNRFVINIQKDQVNNVASYFQEKGLADVQLHPMVRARLEKINGEPVIDAQQEGERAQRLSAREFNLTWAADLQADNNVVSGQWWSGREREARQFSVEEGLAKALKISMGDSLLFDIAGEKVSGVVTNFRKVKWDTFKANFFVIAPPELLQDKPASYMTSFYLSPSSANILDGLIKQFPNLTVIDVSAIMNQVRSIIDRVTIAVEYVFLFTLIAGVMVLYAAIQATHDERIKENAILRALGASKQRLMQSMVAEFVLLGALAGLMAAILSQGLSYVLAEKVMSLSFSFNPWILPLGLIGGALGVGLAGIWGTRTVLVKPPMQTIRQI